MEDDFEGEFYDTSLEKFHNYDEYLDYHITEEDLFYLEDIELARQLKVLCFLKYIRNKDIELKLKFYQENNSMKRSKQWKKPKIIKIRIKHRFYVLLK